jgi:hypothetical protein
MTSPPAPAIALGSVSELIAPAGLNLVGAVAAEAFDASQPSGRRVRDLAPRCGTVVVAASGGRAFWERMLAAGPLRTPHPWYRPMEKRCERIGAEVTAWLADRGVAARLACPHRHPLLNFTQMAEMAGLGVVSPVSEWLLHPQFGPWLSVRFALLVDGLPFGASFRRAIAGEFQPCAGCDQPCVRACPVAACGNGSMDHGRCATWRHEGGCESGCEMKRACPRGVEHRFGPQEEHFRQAYALFDGRREHGLGGWRLVPRRLRARP